MTKEFDTVLALHLEEYKTLREEIISLQEFARKNVTTTYTGIGILIAAAPFIVSYNLEELFLVFPFFFYGLALASVKYALAVLNIGSYLKLELIPAIRELLRGKGSKDVKNLFEWEYKPGVVKKYGFLLLPATGAHYWITLLSAALSIVAYFYFSSGFSFFMCSALCANGFLMTYTALAGMYAALAR